MMSGKAARSTLYTQTTISVADAYSVAPPPSYATIHEVCRHKMEADSHTSRSHSFKNHRSTLNGVDEESSYPLKGLFQP